MKMLKIMATFGILVGLSVIVHAGTPVDTYYQGQPALSNTSIFGSTNTVNQATITLVPPTINSGGSATSCRNCFTRIVLGLTAGTSYYALDGGTTVQFVIGPAISSTGGILSLPEDHLGPLCMTAGNTTTLKLLGAAAPSNFLNYEGYTNCGGTANAGPMQ